ncbi:MAG: UDP-3-O-(3-hydroxymyristoyl)glucosamine N-acyltransferase [Chitinophagaceae bacterium]|nr:UDP-3-O-(3-hydroxymyristoyl)glucosamine N-acyltransferase [Chitinophagaceae bacterium]
MQFSATQIANLLGGKTEGNADAKVTGVAKIEEAVGGSLCFISNPKYEEYLYHTKASVVLVNNSLKLSKNVSCTLIRVPDAYASFASLLQKYNELIANQAPKGIEQPSFIAASAQIGNDVYIGAFCYIADDAVIEDGASIYPNSFVGKGARIGKNAKLFAGVKIYESCKVGQNVIIHAGTVVGCDGFGFAPQPDGSYQKIPQIGNVVIEDDVEIGANCAIDRATMGTTIIRKGAKLDNLIQIAHNVEVGQHTVIAAQSGIAGSTKIGRYCMVGGQAGIIGHIQIADHTNINAQSGVAKSVLEPHTVLNGTPAFDYKSVLKSQAIFRHLPEINNKVKDLEKTVALLTQQIATLTKAATNTNG